jgi:hypothetical protein
MDYTQYPILEFRRKFFKIFGAEISIVDPATDQLVGYIKMKMWSLKGDVRVFTDQSMTTEIVRIGGRQKISMQKVYDVFDSTSGVKIASIRQKSLRSFFVRDHMDILDGNDNIFADVQETSSELAIIRRWIAIIPYIGPLIELILMFVVQTFTISYDPNAPQLMGNITHKKNPFIVKMTLDTTNAQMKLDPRINIAVVSLLSVLDASKNK